VKKLFKFLVAAFLFATFLNAFTQIKTSKENEIKNLAPVEQESKGSPILTERQNVSNYGNYYPDAPGNVQIGSGTGTSTYFPLYSCYGYNYSQQIYLASEITAAGGAPGNITKIRFKYVSGGTTFANWTSWTVYLGNTSKTTFASTTDWVPVGSMTQVFSGNIPTPVAGTWIELTLATPFNYTAGSNIVVAVDENSASYSCTANWQSFASGSNRGILYYSDGTNPNPASPPTANYGPNATIAQIQFYMEVSANPLLSVSSLTGFGNVCINSTAGPNSFTITGTNLTTANVTVGPLTGFTFSTTSGGTYSSSLSLSQPGGAYSQAIYVKFSPTLVQSYNGNIPVGGGGASTVNCAAAGSGVNSPPTISTPTASVTSLTTATLGGNITSTGCSNVTERGIYYSTTNGFPNGTGTKVSETPGPYSTGAFTENVTGLSPNTTYYYVAFATNGQGTVYTTQGSFYTYLFGLYCTSNAIYTADEELLNVTLGTLNNSSTCSTTGGLGSILNEYSNYTTTVSAPDLTQNTSVPFSVQIGTCGGSYSNGIAIWIDYNQNKVFDASERVYYSAASTSGAHTETGNITIPASATLGNTMMRVVCVETTTPNTITACGTYSWGETEDYLVNIVSAVNPMLNITPSSLAFGYVPVGSTSTEQTYTLSGTNLSSSPITVTAPAGFEVSLTSGLGFGSSVSASFTPPTLGNTTIYFRFAPTLLQAYSGNITNAGGGATTVNVAVTGTSILTYCSAGSSTCDEYISNVTVGTINNSTACSTGGYGDYTAQSTNMYIGASNTITVTNGIAYTGDQCGIWVDWNHNGVFTDANETITVSGGPASYTATITPPVGSYIGTTRMRVRILYTGTVSSCGTTTYGEVEDYSIVVDNIPPYPIITVAPVSKSFGNITVGGGSADQVFTISNTGGGTLSIDPGGLILSGPDAGNFLLSDNNTYPVNLNNGQSTTVSVQFAPNSTGAKSINMHIDNNAGPIDIPLSGTGILNPPQSLLGSLNASFLPSLSWQAPAPGAEIKLDDGTVEQNMWVGSPSTTNQMFYDKFVSPHNGTISQIALYTYAGAAGLSFNSVMLCPDDGTGKPNIASPYATFSNVAVGTSISWVFLTLSTPQSVTMGQTFYIVTQWPAGSTNGPYIGTDNTSPAYRSYWTQDGGTTWNSWSGNFIMRAYMGTYTDKLISGESSPMSKIMPVVSASKSTEITYKKGKEKLMSLKVPEIYTPSQEKVLSSYTVYRGISSGSYNTQFSGVAGTTYDDNTAVMGNTYYYVVQAIYTDGSSAYSNEVSVTALNPNYGTFATNLYKFSNSTANGNPAPGEKPVFEWILTNEFTPITTWTVGTDDDGYFLLNFPGQYFKFFGTDYSAVYIGTNGYVTFGAGSQDYTPGGILPNATDPFNMIAAAFKDLYVRRTYTPATVISYKINPDNVVINFENIYDVSASSGTNYISFQITLYTSTVSPTMNSLFLINYNDDMSAAPLASNTIVTGASVGVNNGTGTAGYNYRYAGTKAPMFNGVGKSSGALALGMNDFTSGTLPVKLASFTCSVSGRDANLNWVTESEYNNSGFEIYRKNIKEDNWTKAGYLKGQGNKETPTTYRFTDVKLNTGKYEYKLKQIDLNGNYTFLNLNSTIEIGVPAKFNLSQNYPNPFNPQTKIDFDLPSDSKVTILVYDLLGREIKRLVNNELKKAGYYTVDFDGSGYSSGTYFCRIIADPANGNDFSAVKKMILLK